MAFEWPRERMQSNRRIGREQCRASTQRTHPHPRPNSNPLDAFASKPCWHRPCRPLYFRFLMISSLRGCHGRGWVFPLFAGLSPTNWPNWVLPYTIVWFLWALHASERPQWTFGSTPPQIALGWKRSFRRVCIRCCEESAGKAILFFQPNSSGPWAWIGRSREPLQYGLGCLFAP